MDEHEPSGVAVLTVSHVDAEDLADRIRGQRLDDGFIAGPTIEGPGWSGPREYAAGDRVLFHTRCGPRGQRIVNGTTATVTAITPHGLTVRPDGTDSILGIDAAFVEGTRPDGSPNLSHAWARTVDGAQGGTWTAAHLLGTPALDQYRGYVGQSRSRTPTHTWNTIPGLTLDHIGALADQRDPGERVLAALARTPDPTMAAACDPTIEDRRLRGLIQEHENVLRRRPPDQVRALARAVQVAEKADQRLDRDRRDVAALDEERAKLNPFAGLTGAGRHERNRLTSRRIVAASHLHTAKRAAREAATEVAALRQKQARVERFDVAEGWRTAEVKRFREELAEHWTRTALACVRGDDPLAHGVDVVRRALAHRGSQLRHLDASLPADRGPEQRRTTADLARAVRARHRAAGEVTAARQHLEEPASRLRRRADIEQARRGVDDAVARLRSSTSTEETLRGAAEGLGRHQDQRRAAVAATAPARAALLVDHHDLTAALQATLVERVNQHALGPPEHLLATLGRTPETAAGRAVWCHYAAAIEAGLDSGTTDRSWLNHPHEGARRYIDTADHNTATITVSGGADLDTWAAIADAIPHPPRPRHPDREHKLERALDLGIDL
jgi:hypothetical protein